MSTSDFFELSTNFLCELDNTGNLLAVNPVFFSSLGYLPEDIISQPLRSLVEADEIAVFDEGMRALAKTSSAHFDVSMRHQDGKSVLVSWSFYRREGDRILGVGDDRGLEDVLGKVLQASIEKSSALLEAISDGFLTLDRTCTVTDINLEGEKILRRSYAGLVGKSILNELPELIETEIFAVFQQANRERAPFSVTEYFSFLDAWVQVRGYPTDEGYALYIRDVTAQVEAEEKLRQSEERYRGIVDSQIDLVCRYLPDTTLTFVNDAYCRFFGKSREELLGSSYLPLSAPSHLDRIHQRLAELEHNPKPGVSEVPTTSPLR